MQFNANYRVKALMATILVLAAILAIGALYLLTRPDTTVIGPSAPHSSARQLKG